MRILLSAYACEPNRGSEAGVGWNWALELARLQHEVWVLTRANNQKAIATMGGNLPPNLHFVYFDLPAWLRFWKCGGTGVQVYYFLWQIGIFFVTKSLMRQHHFERIHHVTFVSVRFPSFLGLLGVPFTFGPVSGGERAPLALRKSYPLYGKLRDGVRDMLNAWVCFDPLMHLTFTTAERIFATTRDTLALIPKRYRYKTDVKLAIGIDLEKNMLSQQYEEDTNPTDTFEVLYAGNLLYLKGLHLAMAAFANLVKKHPNSRFTLIGSGPEECWLKSLVKQYGLDHTVMWRGKMTQQKLQAQYPLYDVFLFPSLHDSGGMVILEAMACGLPTVCLDLGGPGILVNDTCGQVVNTENKDESAVIDSLTSALLTLAKNPVLRKQLSEGARQRVKEFSWPTVVQGIYSV